MFNINIRTIVSNNWEVPQSGFIKKLVLGYSTGELCCRINDIDGMIYHYNKPFAPSFLYAFWRMCKERFDEIEISFERAVRVSYLSGEIIKFYIMTLNEKKKRAEYIHLGIDEDYYPDEISTIIDPNSVIISDNNIKIEFSFSLAKPILFSFGNKEGFSRKNLYSCIKGGYRKIYDKGMNNKWVNNNPHIINSGLPIGPYGILNPGLEEITLGSLRFNTKSKILSFKASSE